MSEIKTTSDFNGRSVADLTADELQALASEAFSEAAARAIEDGYLRPGLSTAS